MPSKGHGNSPCGYRGTPAPAKPSHQARLRDGGTSSERDLTCLGSHSQEAERLEPPPPTPGALPPPGSLSRGVDCWGSQVQLQFRIGVGGDVSAETFLSSQTPPCQRLMCPR